VATTSEFIYLTTREYFSDQYASNVVDRAVYTKTEEQGWDLVSFAVVRNEVVFVWRKKRHGE
jgi:hypothetical protein